ncbi:unnamed protein product [Meganyctiphanes norvegica]|uniref:Uncharacterized protein n=1 Tax=Meganyctiphanes norvegica TaxID=48144 RepID=A0AAV2RZ96_MEGNR
MNRGTSNHYALLLQDDAENEGIAMEEEEEEEEEKVARSPQLNSLQEDDMIEQDYEDDEDDDDINEDSDEEEIFSSSKHRTLSHHEGPNLNGGLGNEYCLLNNSDGDLKTTTLENPVTIWTGPAPMSPARRACFIASIMFGVLVVASFVLVLPCDVQPCEGINDNAQSSWAVQIDGMGCNNTLLVGRLHSDHNVLLSYYTAANVSKWETASDNSSQKDELLHNCDDSTDCWSNEDGSSHETNFKSSSISDGECGLLLLDGTSGTELWRTSLPECPNYVQCDSVDASGDGLPDCIIQGSDTMTVMVEPHYGNIIWYLETRRIPEASGPPSYKYNIGDINTKKTSKQQQATSKSGPNTWKHKQAFHHSGPPLPLTDANSDGMHDLIVPGYISMGNGDVPPQLGHANELILVSGKTGILLGKPVRLNKCYSKLKLHWKMERLQFSCITHNFTKVNGHIPLHDLLHKILGPETPASLDYISNHPQPGNPQPLLNPHLHPGICEIKVKKIENCTSCASKFQVFHPLDNKIIWEQEFSKNVIVSWKLLSSESKQCYGAIIKLWKVQHIYQEENPTSALPFSEYQPYLTNMDKANSIDKNGSIKEESFIRNEIYEIDQSNFSHNEIDINSSVLTTTNSVPLQENITINQTNPEKNSEDTRQIRDINIDKNKLYEHPTIHRHHGKVTSASHENITDDIPVKSKTTSSPSDFALFGVWNLPPNVEPPIGYELQHIHEQILLVKPSKNGTWIQKTITEIQINQLCKNQHCIPSLNSHTNSVQVTEGRKKGSFQILCYTSTFSTTDSTSTTTESNSDEVQDTWNLITIIRNIIINI